METERFVEGVCLSVFTTDHQRDGSETVARQSGESPIEEESSQSLPLHGGAHCDLGKVGMARRYLRSDHESARTIDAIACKEGRGWDRIAAPPPMKNIVQKRPATVTRPVELIHLRVDTTLVSFLHEASSIRETTWAANLEEKVWILLNLAREVLEGSAQKRPAVLCKTARVEKL